MNDEYDRLLETARGNDPASEVSPSNERRREPRIPLSRHRLQITINANVNLVDISASGISLLSEHQASPGTDISISVDQGYQVVASVVECTMVESDESLMEAKYRLHCIFADPDAGKLLAVSLNSDDPA